jgi:hypothetical protein
LELEIVEIISTWSPNYKKIHIWKILKPKCEINNGGSKQIKNNALL